MGLGRERRISRSVVLLSGLVLGTAVADVAGSAFGLGWWQIGVVLGVTAVLAGLLFDRELAVTYATINAVVLNGIPASDGMVADPPARRRAREWPQRSLSPTESYHHAHIASSPGRLRTLAVRAADGLELAADELRSDADDRRPAVVRDAAASGSTRELQRVPGTVEYALDLARWAPIRRRDAGRVEDLVDSSSPLVDALTTGVDDRSDSPIGSLS
jgi:hypothetical protein